MGGEREKHAWGAIDMVDAWPVSGVLCTIAEEPNYIQTVSGHRSTLNNSQPGVLQIIHIVSRLFDGKADAHARTCRLDGSFDSEWCPYAATRLFWHITFRTVRYSVTLSTWCFCVAKRLHLTPGDPDELSAPVDYFLLIPPLYGQTPTGSRRPTRSRSPFSRFVYAPFTLLPRECKMTLRCPPAASGHCPEPPL